MDPAGLQDNLLTLLPPTHVDQNQKMETQELSRVAATTTTASNMPKSFKRRRNVVQFSEQPPAAIALPPCPMNQEETGWFGWYSGMDKKVFERDVKETIKAYKRAKRDRREVPKHLCFRGIEDHLSSRHQLQRKSQINLHTYTVLQEQAHRYNNNNNDDGKGDIHGAQHKNVVASHESRFFMGDKVASTSEWAMHRALALGKRDAAEAMSHLMEEEEKLEHNDDDPHSRLESTVAAVATTNAATVLQVEQAARVIAREVCAPKNQQWPLGQMHTTETQCVIPVQGRAA
mmetsp:Transcript_12969/g.22040  ORF Transcript_12969/g.22040 Transcript_12969/m.22040 type:complete len:288 (-) Transcript_12969:66-929(-)|eukprot:CAMPEP_0116559722 /NCGR_PEP_ID=MMETSP0397-20121206/10565_1 /TAXON_ID=216820 /ORGANISM="Cyclophora tenuis, Strain ECT3854" /LENGTH=287 /DNA_ID=CAMNT_0004085545 /DNA_START=40 /DNA_END=903 /DNA_ORIENTATION=+